MGVTTNNQDMLDYSQVLLWPAAYGMEGDVKLMHTKLFDPTTRHGDCIDALKQNLEVYKAEPSLMIRSVAEVDASGAPWLPEPFKSEPVVVKNSVSITLP